MFVVLVTDICFLQCIIRINIINLLTVNEISIAHDKVEINRIGLSINDKLYYIPLRYLYVCFLY